MAFSNPWSWSKSSLTLCPPQFDSRKPLLWQPTWSPRSTVPTRRSRKMRIRGGSFPRRRLLDNNDLGTVNILTSLVSGYRTAARSEAARQICLPRRLSGCRILPEQLTAVIERGMNRYSMHLRTLTSADSRRPPPAGSRSSTSRCCCEAGPPASSGSMGPCARRLSGSCASSSSAAFWSTASPGSGAPSVAGA